MESSEVLAGYAVIGDVHGMGNQLIRLLRHLGYDDDAGYFRHPNRQALFVGDLFFGHYWRQGLPELTDLPNAACVDFSACRGGPMTAYRWSGEQNLDPANFSWVEQNPSA